MLPSRSFISAVIGLLGAVPHAFAQVTTECQPLNTTNCPPDPAFGTDFDFQFNRTPISGTWKTTAGEVRYTPKYGAEFQINKQGDSPTIRTNFYIFLGRVEIFMKAASGTGIISSVMLLSDCLDEIDWEFMGGNGTHVQTSYFGKGINDHSNAIHHPVDRGVQGDYHNYTLDWTKDALKFYVDSINVRTLLPEQANRTRSYPQTPMRVFLGIWAGGDPTLSKGTREWAGGDTDYNAGPYTMHVMSTRIIDYSKAKEYVYGDMSGTHQSIKLVEEGKNSTAKEAIEAPPPKSISERFNELSPVAKTGVYASGAGVVALLAGWALIYCIRQRRRGAREAKMALQQQEQERMELERYHKAGINPDSFSEQTPEYNAREMAQEGMADKDSYSVPQSSTNEKWSTVAALDVGATVGYAAVNRTRSPMPLLQQGAQPPPLHGPGPSKGLYAGGGYAPPPLTSPERPMAPGMPPSGPLPSTPGNRSYRNPYSQMPDRNSGPQAGPYGGMQRMTSPAPMGPAQRGFTNPQQQHGQGGYENDGYWR